VVSVQLTSQLIVLISFSFHWPYYFLGLGSRSFDVGLWNSHGPGNAYRCGTCTCRKYLRLYDMGHYYAGLHRNDGCGESSSAVFPTFAMLRMNSLLG